MNKTRKPIAYFGAVNNTSIVKKLLVTLECIYRQGGGWGVIPLLFGFTWYLAYEGVIYLVLVFSPTWVGESWKDLLFNVHCRIYSTKFLGK